MTAQTQTETKTKFSIHPAAEPRLMHLTVNDLERQIAFHTDVLGFKLHWRKDGQAGLGAGRHDLFRFTESREARHARGTTGLYHTAILVPTRWDLAQLLRSIAVTQTPVQGFSNHVTHLAIYLPDAEGNGLELAWDFPRAQWPMVNGKLGFGRGEFNINELLAELERDPRPWTGLHPDTKIGHVHLHVSDYDATLKFYHELLGFDVTVADKKMGAIFVSAGGYHHHIGLNLWQGIGAPPPPANALGLRYFTIALPSEAEVERLTERVRRAGVETQQVEAGILIRDPAENGIVLVNAAV